VGNVLGPEERKCGKTVHMGMMARGFTVYVNTRFVILYDDD
jgi:hypothetical protein